MIKGAIFDMDGLMFDTERLSLKGWLYAGEKYGYPITSELIDEIRGTNTAYSKALFQERFGDLVDYDLARRERTKYMDDFIEKHGVPVKEGLIELLEFLKTSGIKMAVATSTNKELAEKYLKMAGIYSYFHATVYGNQVKKGKPDPEIFLTAAKQLNLSPKECVVFEDSPHGIAAGHAAGCMVVAIPDMAPIACEYLDIIDYKFDTLRGAIPMLQTLGSYYK